MNRRLVAIAVTLVLLVGAAPAWARPLKFAARLSGAQQNPEVATAASGKLTVKFDEALTQVEIKLTLADLSDFTAAHFHCNRAGLDGGVAFGIIMPGPCTLEGTQIRCTLTNADLTPNTCDSAIGRPINNIASLAFAMRDGLIYANVHTAAHTAGEIRGQLIGK